MTDLLDIAIEEAKSSPVAAELHRASKRYDELRTSPAWAELREEFKRKRSFVVKLLGEKALRGAPELRDEGIYTRGFLDGCEMLLERPDEVEQKLGRLVNDSLEKLRREILEATLEQSPYG